MKDLFLWVRVCKDKFYRTGLFVFTTTNTNNENKTIYI